MQPLLVLTVSKHREESVLFFLPHHGGLSCAHKLSKARIQLKLFHPPASLSHMQLSGNEGSKLKLPCDP